MSMRSPNVSQTLSGSFSSALGPNEIKEVVDPEPLPLHAPQLAYPGVSVKGGKLSHISTSHPIISPCYLGAFEHTYAMGSSLTLS